MFRVEDEHLFEACLYRRPDGARQMGGSAPVGRASSAPPGRRGFFACKQLRGHEAELKHVTRGRRLLPADVKLDQFRGPVLPAIAGIAPSGWPAAAEATSWNTSPKSPSTQAPAFRKCSWA